jgi:hypothetical protein
MIKKIDLESYRRLGDKNADEVIEGLVQQEGVDYLRKLMPFLSDYKQLSIQNHPQVLQDFLNTNCSFPSFYNKKQIIRSTEFYSKFQDEIGLVLGLYSLPFCYLGADGAKVLYFSERIRNDTFKRLQETGNFLKAVMDFDNWKSDKIFKICLKVRLLHAAIRYFTLKSGRWDSAWGHPINQEDMVGTNLAFSIIVLWGLDKLGYSIDKSYEEAYINTWNVIGFLLGIESDLLPHSYQDTIKIGKWIEERQFKESMEGKALTESLMRVIRGFAPNVLVAEILQAQSRHLLGDKYANMLGISETNIPNTLLKLYNTTTVLLSKKFY